MDGHDTVFWRGHRAPQTRSFAFGVPAGPRVELTSSGHLWDWDWRRSGGRERPWPHQYRIRPEQKDRLTAADVVGPDGIVYPNWTLCGVQGGIPKVEVAATSTTSVPGR